MIKQREEAFLRRREKARARAARREHRLLFREENDNSLDRFEEKAAMINAPLRASHYEPSHEAVEDLPQRKEDDLDVPATLSQISKELDAALYSLSIPITTRNRPEILHPQQYTSVLPTTSTNLCQQEVSPELKLSEMAQKVSAELDLSLAMMQKRLNNGYVGHDGVELVLKQPAAKPTDTVAKDPKKEKYDKEAELFDRITAETNLLQTQGTEEEEEKAIDRFLDLRPSRSMPISLAASAEASFLRPSPPPPSYISSAVYTMPALDPAATPRHRLHNARSLRATMSHH